MSFLRTFYKTKNLSSNGAFILGVVLILLFIGEFIIPTVDVKSVPDQIATLNGYNLKYGDSPEVELFIRSIKENNGVLCLGTSESTELGGLNYYHYLNNDPDLLNTRFSILAGAGRTCGKYIPLLMARRNLFDSLQIIYMINPVYWRNDLSKPSKEYWYRYSGYSLGNNLQLNNKDKELFSPVTEYYEKLNFFEKSIQVMESTLRKKRRKYFHDLYYWINPDRLNNQFDLIPNKKKDLSREINFINSDFSDLDTNWNILKAFKNHHWFDPISASEKYRYKELMAFVLLCKELKINATYIICPFNERFIKNYSPQSLKGYINTTNQIKLILENEQCSYVDATDISGLAGTFNDHQHYSSYGAFLIYKKLKSRFK